LKAPPRLDGLPLVWGLLGGTVFSQNRKNEIFEIGKGAKKLERRAELLKYIDNDPILIPMVDRLLFLEGKLEELEKLPLLRINPDNPVQQKATPAAKLYKEYLQQYVNVFKALERATGADTEEESPLRKWAKSRNVETDK
jgi:hypothetical protein